MAFSMQQFMSYVNKPASGHFTYSKSSMKPIVDYLGGPIDKNKPDARTPSLNEKIEIQKLIWRIGVAGDTWSLKKQKYKDALGYLANQLFAVDGALALKLGQEKASWKLSALRRTTVFIHCSAVSLDQVHQWGGFDPAFSTEFCYPRDQLCTTWQWNQFFFAFPPLRDDSGDALPKMRGAQGHLGFGHAFLITQPRGTEYMGQFALEDLTTGKGSPEFGFPNKIPLNRIKAYDEDGQDITPNW